MNQPSDCHGCTQNKECVSRGSVSPSGGKCRELLGVLLWKGLEGVLLHSFQKGAWLVIHSAVNT